MNPPGEQHNHEIHRNLQHWNNKPALRQVYHDFYQLILGEIDQSIPGTIVELGAGIGNLKSYLPQALCTDLFANPWIDQVENAYKLSFKSESVSHLILFDVFHHLQYPGTALDEFARVLKPGGRLLIFEPDIGLVGWLVYGLFHTEPVARFKPVTWRAPANVDLLKAPYYAAQGNAHRAFLRQEWREQLSSWTVHKIWRKSALAYLATGGYSKKQLVPDRLFPILKKIEPCLDQFPALFSSRLLVVLKKRDAGTIPNGKAA